MIKHLLFFLILLTSCAQSVTQPHVKAINKLMGKATKEITLDHPNLVPIGYGGEMMGDIQTVYLHFYCLANVDINEARNIYIECVERVKNTINNDNSIRPYLHIYPFTINELDITINFIDSSRKFVCQEDLIALVFFSKSQIKFCTYDPNAPLGNRFYKVHSESYEEALRIYRSELNVN